MSKKSVLAAPIDMSTGFKDFFDTIGVTSEGIITKSLAAVIGVIAIKMLLTLSNDPKSALRKGSMAIGTLFVALVLGLYGDTLFATVTSPKS
ncbi:hypothetical protein [Streptomyces antimicrobicus]|uniref:Uncharacterized protein n=1 Tax=Streptomyces antimicrobicus TaxID=2883108 RepID=A0ABS8BAC9_9ACTN|nr:hypothetical protein [Streptomyces antimicrobicus]MCB5181501.1 hypothetical protein [Streptomyces antimicrobicus]